jgi:phosphate regulon transcriptional regulator PhoB
MKNTILVADDEEDVLNLVSANLKNVGYTVMRAENGESALNAARGDAPSLIVLDLMLPGMTGLEVCKVLKSDPATSNIPIIMLTAKAEEVDRILGLELGADDYITKPFSPRELVLRVKSVIRRGGGSNDLDKVLNLGKISLDRTHHQVKVRSKPLDLTPTEFKLLMILMERKGRVQSRERLLSDVWGYENLIDTRTVDTHVRRLREKLGSEAQWIETVRGFGYRVSAAEL